MDIQIWKIKHNIQGLEKFLDISYNSLNDGKIILECWVRLKSYN